MPRVFNGVFTNLGMLEEHRNAIRHNYDMLVSECNIQALIPKFLTKNIFSIEMIKHHTSFSNDIEIKKSFFLSLPKRGPKAFENFIQCLRETDQHDIANVLLRDADDNANAPNIARGETQLDDRGKLCQLPSYSQDTITNIPHLETLVGKINLGTTPLAVEVKFADKFYDDNADHYYQTHSKRRGAALVINNYQFINNIENPRNGAEIDDSNLKELFKQMNMNVYLHVNLTGKEMKERVSQFAQSPTLKNLDMIFVFIMSHGRKDQNGNTVIVGTDSAEVTTEWVEQQFNNQNCVHMQKKPKMLVFQICRGDMPDYGTMNKRIETDSIRVPLRTLSDVLIAHSTTSGYASHRDIYLGSWYIQSICKVFMLHCHDTHVEDLFKLVDQELENYRSEKMGMQTSSYTSYGFNRKCYLHPGIYLEDGVLKRFTPLFY